MNRAGDWFIDKVAIKNFRCFKTIEIDFSRSLTVLVGVNGVGKTAVLDAIAVALSTVIGEFHGKRRGFLSSDAHQIPENMGSEKAIAEMISSYPISVSTEAVLNGSELSWTRTKQSKKGGTSWAEKNTNVGKTIRRIWDNAHEAQNPSPILPIISLYGVERLVSRNNSKIDHSSRESAYDGALDNKADLSRLSSYIKALSYEEFRALKEDRASTKATSQLEAISLACNMVLAETGWKNPRWNAVIDEIELTHDRFGTLPLSLLSSGIKIVSGLIIDLVSRMARANPGLGGAELLQSVPGIVLIDEVGLHLHPGWQQTIISQLQRIFPRVQFILTTHSPQVLSTVAAENIRIINRDEVLGVQYSKGLRSDVVLDRVLGVSPSPNLQINEYLNDYMDLVNGGSGTGEKAIKLREILDRDLGGFEFEDRLAEADAIISFYGVDDL